MCQQKWSRMLVDVSGNGYCCLLIMSLEKSSYFLSSNFLCSIGAVTRLHGGINKIKYGNMPKMYMFHKNNSLKKYWCLIDWHPRSARGLTCEIS